LIEAEVLAGNDNKSLLAEAKEILLAFARQGVIDKKEATRFYRQLERANN
jgi:ribosomal protein S20